MKFQIWCARKDSPGVEWSENFDYETVFDQISAEMEANRMLKEFNETLRPGESPRLLLRTIFGEGDAAPRTIPHNWEKTNLITIAGKKGAGTWDTYKCTACGITAKRHGIGAVFIRDNKYAKNVSCKVPDEVKKQIQKVKEERRTPEAVRPGIGEDNNLRSLDERERIQWENYAQMHDPSILVIIGAIARRKAAIYASLGG